VDFDFGNGKRVNIKWDFGVKKCIIMQFFGGGTQKVHYSAVFGGGKIGGKDKDKGFERRDAECAEKDKN
jgi:hypothetical protein